MLLLVLIGLLTVACGGSDTTTSSADSAEPTATRAAAALLAPTPAIEPVRLPQDEAPHDRLTEWWYYTGHLITDEGVRYGFEYVIFQAQRGMFAPYYASHVAITDSAADRFTYDQRAAPDARREINEGFSLDLGGWTMTGANGRDHLAADLQGFAFDLDLTATKPAALHNGNGYVEFGAAGGSYYYSRTRMDVNGVLTVDGQALAVHGEAWMDHQWGDFIQVGGGGWDWFSVQLTSGWDLTISVVRDEDRDLVTAYGTLIDPDGGTTHLDANDIDVQVLDEWTSPHTAATYPSAWRITLPEHDWSLTVRPSMADQELQTQETTGVIYWEGEVIVEGAVDGQAVDGLGYVELTGYATSDAPSLPSLSR